DHMEVVWRSSSLNDENNQSVDFNKADRGAESDNQHKRLNHLQEQGFNFYVTSKIDIPKPESSFTYNWEQYSDKLELIKKLHFD
ncbi:hypothetical protein LLH32_20340, partial [Bacillus nakamurai]|nr:hypothetical protein [Bacillus nakamurai]